MGTITKALNLLNYFSAEHIGIGLTQFVKLTGSDKATVHRHLVELEQNGFLEQDPVTRAYQLGPAILRLSAVRETTRPLRATVRPIIRSCADEIGELMHFSVLQGKRLSGVYFYDPKVHGTRVSFDGSGLYPLHATASGQAFLAYADKAFVDEYLSTDLTKFNELTVTDPAELRKIIQGIYQKGHSSSRGAYDSEVASHAVPVFGTGGRLIGALSLAIPVSRYSEDIVPDIVSALHRGTVQITNSIGGSFPPELAGKWH